MTLSIGSLFAGIGGLEKGLEDAGLGPVVWQVEREAFARSVLAKHWPNADRHIEDVHDAGRRTLAAVDIICGGFPCQPHSHAGKGGGVADERYLWPQYARVVREFRPSYVVVENVANILADGTALRVLSDLASLGYDAEWSVVSACSVGASHTRDRLFLVAYADRLNGAEGVRHQLFPRLRPGERRHDGAMPRAGSFLRLEDQSRLYGGADGISDRVDRNRACGNAVVPAVAEVVGRLILSREAANASEAA